MFPSNAIAADRFAGHILVLGNSIALHPPRAEVGWTGNWGMAASNVNNDFAHLLQTLLTQKKQIPKLDVLNLSVVEKQYRQYVPSLLRQIKPGADLVVVVLGDNVPVVDFDPKQWFGAYDAVLSAAVEPNSRLVCVSTWGGNMAVDQVIRSVCTGRGGQYADIHHFKKILANQAGSERHFENAGVASHPGDKGMREIAQAVLEAYQQHPENKPISYD